MNSKNTILYYISGFNYGDFDLDDNAPLTGQFLSGLVKFSLSQTNKILASLRSEGLLGKNNRLTNRGEAYVERLFA